MNNVCETCGSGNLYGEVCKVMPGGGLRELMSVGEDIGLEYGKVVDCFDFLTDSVDDAR